MVVGDVDGRFACRFHSDVKWRQDTVSDGAQTQRPGSRSIAREPRPPSMDRRKRGAHFVTPRGLLAPSVSAPKTGLAGDLQRAPNRCVRTPSDKAVRVSARWADSQHRRGGLVRRRVPTQLAGHARPRRPLSGGRHGARTPHAERHTPTARVYDCRSGCRRTNDGDGGDGGEFLRSLSIM